MSAKVLVSLVAMVCATALLITLLVVRDGGNDGSCTPAMGVSCP